jgi:dihydroorotate dehydrogenase (fumarate)
VNVGLANEGSDFIIKRLDNNQNINPRHNIILSVAKTNTCEVTSVEQGIEDYVASAKRANKSKIIRMIELNISCPNTYGGEPFNNPKDLDKLLVAIDNLKLCKPVVIKMPVDLSWAKTSRLLDVIIQHKVEGVTISNLAKDRSLLDLGDELPDEVVGNLSGKPTFELSNELIRQTYIKYGDKLKIIGVGGVFSADDAYLKIKLGASLVEFISAFIYQGPQLASEINYDLVGMLKRDGYKNISQAVGVDSKKRIS